MAGPPPVGVGDDEVGALASARSRPAGSLANDAEYSESALPSITPADAASTSPSPSPATTTGFCGLAVCTIVCGSATGNTCTFGGSGADGGIASSIASIIGCSGDAWLRVCGPKSTGVSSPGAASPAT